MSEQGEKMVYAFGAGKAEGATKMKNLLGGKGANLAEMSNLGIAVPCGFTITTDVCTEFNKRGQNFPPGLRQEVIEHLKRVEEVMGAKFGDQKNPLLLSVRSGARVSMPGMMDTVLNLGLNYTTIEGLIRKTNNERFAYDSYRRFIQMYSNVVMGLDSEILEHELEEMKRARGVKLDTELNAADLKELVQIFKKKVKETLGSDFPEDPMEQLWGGISAVFKSWNVPRAITYRKLNNIPEEWGTAVNVQAMVFGNMGNDSATGVAFTRDPATGENVFFGEYLTNAQGEDVVAGIRTPQPINMAGKKDSGLMTLEEEMPEVYKQLEDIYHKLENHYRDMQDIEFTIQQGKLWMLQTRTGKRTAAAAVKIAVDMYREGLISKEEAVLRIDPAQVDQLLHPMFDPKAKKTLLGNGLPASPGAAVGKVVFSADDAEGMAKSGEKVILVRLETSPDDIHGMNAAEGILTARGGMTSHAAVVARGMGKPCVSGAGKIHVDYKNQEFTAKDVKIKRGDFISIDGSKGEIYQGQIPTIKVELSGDFGELMSWVDDIRRLKVRTNADTPYDSKVGRDFGAEGIGLCRTEHMFFESERIEAVREMILAEDKEGREKALAKIEPMQRDDFVGIFKAMDGLPVTIRLLDPPLHEFLPHTQEAIDELASKLQVSPEKLRIKRDTLKEFNPMLGHRGCRLGIIYPEISAMQARAILDAACICAEEGVKVLPEIMIPLVGHHNEYCAQKKIIEEVADEVFSRRKAKVEFLIGTMIELPRAALTADEIAKEAEFFSFGTNDLTQTTFGLSRDDSGMFLPAYVEMGILPEDPFVKLDQQGVGQLVQIGVERGRKSRPDLKVGICGEHGGEPSSVEFCHRLGMNYVSCSPYRVPIARLAAAHAVIKETMQHEVDV